MAAVYYNEFDPFAAAWLKELIKKGHIADGEVDTRSIVDIAPEDLKGFRQHHFFAGIGGWAYAVRLAGLDEAEGLWTGSCPCQPFSTAGKQRGKADERHLWPVWFRLIRECRPAIVFGEQVASAIAHRWLDEVANDMEGEGYAIGAAVLPACSVGRPHRRDRLWFVGHTEGARNAALARIHARQGVDSLRGSKSDGDVAHSHHHQQEQQERHRAEGRGASESWFGAGPRTGGGNHVGRDAEGNPFAGGNTSEVARPVADAETPERELAGASRSRGNGFANGGDVGNACGEGLEIGQEPENIGGDLWQQGQAAAAPGNGSIEWLECPDGKARPVEPGVRLLAHGFPNRVGALRGFGNAIVPEVAAKFMTAALG